MYAGGGLKIEFTYKKQDFGKKIENWQFYEIFGLKGAKISVLVILS